MQWYDHDKKWTMALSVKGHNTAFPVPLQVSVTCSNITVTCSLTPNQPRKTKQGESQTPTHTSESLILISTHTALSVRRMEGRGKGGVGVWMKVNELESQELEIQKSWQQLRGECEGMFWTPSGSKGGPHWTLCVLIRVNPPPLLNRSRTSRPSSAFIYHRWPAKPFHDICMLFVVVLKSAFYFN